MSGSPVTGAVTIERCKWCRTPVTPCTCGGHCIGTGMVHLLSRLHRCANGVSMAYAGSRVRGAA